MTPASPGRSPPSPVVAGLLGRCPRCARASMFDGFLALRSRCPACDLDLTRADTGDGPAFFASFLGGFLLLAAGTWMQVAYEPAFWVYAVLFVIGALAIVGMIRPLKGVLTALQFANGAEQGRLER